jgi:tetratricopeptide (TPR) repeat protein
VQRERLESAGSGSSAFPLNEPGKLAGLHWKRTVYVGNAGPRIALSYPHMPSTKTLAILGFLGALLAAPGLFYLGKNIVSNGKAARRVTVAAPSQAAPPNKEHEAIFLAEALKKKPNHTPVLLRMAQLSAESGKPTEATRNLREVLQREPANDDARLELGKTLFEAGDIQGAIEQTKAILDHKPDHADALYNMGAIYGNLGKSDLARQYWNRLIAKAPQTESAQRAKRMIGQLPPTS